MSHFCDARSLLASHKFARGPTQPEQRVVKTAFLRRAAIVCVVPRTRLAFAAAATPALRAPMSTTPSSSLDSVLVSRVQQLFKESPAEPRSDEDVARRLKQRYRDYRARTDDALKRAVGRVLAALPPTPAPTPAPMPAPMPASTPAAEPAQTPGDAAAALMVDRPPSAPPDDYDLKRGVKRTALSESLYPPSRTATPGVPSPAKPPQAPAAARARGNAERPTLRLSDVGGLEAHMKDIQELCVLPLTHPEVYAHIGPPPPRGILLHGPPGCGKTLLAHAIAGELGCAFFRVSAPEIISGMSGESEENVRALFTNAAAAAPSIIFIDEIDAITPKRESGARGLEVRVVAQLLTCMDGVGAGSSGVLVIGATNRPDALDPALRRAGRFDREICLGIPDEAARERVLRVLVGSMRIAGDFDYKSIAKRTPGFVGADLAALTKEAAAVAVNRVFSTLLTPGSVGPLMLRVQPEPFTEEQLAPLYVEMRDFEAALPKVQPSAKREGFATVPSVTWADVGALAKVKDELTMAISEPIRRPRKFARMGLEPTGVLLFGPPGCGKTLVAKAVASSSGANFISIKGPELLNKYVGESERAVRQVFARARASAPCVVFFDEFDALCPRRGGDQAGSGVSERVVNQILTEMDGLEARGAIYVLAATNRPELIDPAMIRPGRLGRLVYVPLPCEADRLQILQTCAKRSPIDPEVQLAEVAKRTDGFSGADLASLVRMAAVHALKRASVFGMGNLDDDDDDDDDAASDVMCTWADFEAALGSVAPSVSARDRRAYERMGDHFSSDRFRKELRANDDDDAGA